MRAPVEVVFAAPVVRVVVLVRAAVVFGTPAGRVLTAFAAPVARVVFAADAGVRNDITVTTTNGGPISGITVAAAATAAVCGTDITVAPSTNMVFNASVNGGIYSSGELRVGSGPVGGPTIECAADPTVRVNVQTRDVHGLLANSATEPIIEHLIATNDAYSSPPPVNLAERPAGVAQAHVNGSVTIRASRVMGFPINLLLSGTPPKTSSRTFDLTDTCVDLSGLAGQTTDSSGFPSMGERTYDDYGATGASGPKVNFFSSATFKNTPPTARVDVFTFWPRSPSNPPCPQ